MMKVSSKKLLSLLSSFEEADIGEEDSLTEDDELFFKLIACDKPAKFTSICGFSRLLELLNPQQFEESYKKLIFTSGYHEMFGSITNRIVGIEPVSRERRRVL